jgi:hypothetical protein
MFFILNIFVICGATELGFWHTQLFVHVYKFSDKKKSKMVVQPTLAVRVSYFTDKTQCWVVQIKLNGNTCQQFYHMSMLLFISQK